MSFSWKIYFFGSAAINSNINKDLDDCKSKLNPPAPETTTLEPTTKPTNAPPGEETTTATTKAPEETTTIKLETTSAI